jgi:hypothetical protein
MAHYEGLDPLTRHDGAANIHNMKQSAVVLIKQSLSVILSYVVTAHAETWGQAAHSLNCKTTAPVRQL